MLNADGRINTVEALGTPSQRRDGNINRQSEESNILILNMSAAGKRGLVHTARGPTNEKRLALDKIREFQNFFEYLEAVCSTVDDINPHIKAARTAILSIYKLCEIHKKCRDAFWSLVEEMNDLLNYRLEELGIALRVNSNTQTAFISVAEAIDEVLIFVEEWSKGAASRFIRNIVSTSYESKLKGLRDKLKRAMGSLSDSMSSRRLEQPEMDTQGPRWERVVDNDLRLKLKSVLKAHYVRGEGCLEDTRTNLLTTFDSWIRGPSKKKSMWVCGHAGSGKSALFNSIAENLENAGIPFTFFPCKQDDPELSDTHKILPTIAYSFAELYVDYCKAITASIKTNANNSYGTNDFKKQCEMLFGKTFNLVSQKGSRRPSVHVILVDGFDECKSHRDESKTSQERRAFLETLLRFANTVPWIKVLVSSRPEPNIASFFKDTSYSVHHIDVNDDKWRTSAAIRLFISDTSEKLDLGLSHAQIERLQERASGLFVWCTTALRYIKESKEGNTHVIEYILKDQPVNSKKDPYAYLFPLYQRVLDSAASEGQDKSLIELVLGAVFIASTRRPLSTAAITSIIYPDEQGDNLEERRDWVDNIISSLSSILYVEEGTNVIRTHHITVLDFIAKVLSRNFLTETIVQEEDTNRPLPVDIGEMQWRFFEWCFAVMERELRFNICGLENSYRMNKDVPDLSVRITQNISEALQYSCLFWLSHLGQSSVEINEQVYAFLNSLRALYWVEAFSILDAVDQGILILQNCANTFAAQRNIADLANEWVNFLSVYGDALQSTPHLYLSAISWTPASSRLRDIIPEFFSTQSQFIANIPETAGTDTIVPGMPEVWRASSLVSSVAFSPNGELFASGCWDGSVQVWRICSRKKVREPFKTGIWIDSIAFSPRNRWLASGHSDGKIRLWDLRAESTKPRLLEGHADWITSVSFSPDGKRIVSCSDDNCLRVWDVRSGTPIGTYFEGFNRNATSAIFSANSTQLISVSRTKNVHIRSSETGKLTGALLQDQSEIITSVACSEDGRFMVSGSDDGTVRLWNAKTFEQIGEPFIGLVHNVKCVCFSADGKFIASDSRGICVWSVERHALVCELKGHKSGVERIAFSTDCRNVLSSSLDGTIRVWDIEERALADQSSEGTLVIINCLSYTPDGNLIVSGSCNGRIYIHDARTGAAVGKPIQGHTDSVRALAVSNDGQWVVSGSSDKTLRLWNIASGTVMGEPMLGHSERINSVAVSPDDHLVATASTDNTVRLWDVATHETLTILKGHNRSVTSVAFSADGNHIVSGSWDRTIRIWDTRAGKIVGQTRVGQSDGIVAISMSPDGQWIASASYDTAVYIWDVSSLEMSQELRGHSDPVHSVAFSPCSRYLISGSWDDTLRVWDISTGKTIGTPLRGHTSSIESVAIAPSGLEFVSSSSDGTIRTWDLRARTDLQLYRESKPHYSQNDEERFRIRWNACRSRTANNDGWIRDGKKLLLWVPQQHRPDISSGAKFVIGSHTDKVRPEVDFQQLFRYSGARWRDIATNGGFV